MIPAISSVPPTYSDDAGRAFIERQHRRASEGDGFSFVIAHGDDPEPGSAPSGCGSSEIESGRASIGYWLVPAARGHGLAACALRADRRFAFERAGHPAPPPLRGALERRVGPHGRGRRLPP